MKTRTALAVAALTCLSNACTGATLYNAHVLDLPDDYTTSTAAALNDSGVVIGNASFPNDEPFALSRAWTWASESGLQLLPGHTDPYGNNSVSATAINSFGVVAGHYQDGEHLDAFIWSGGPELQFLKHGARTVALSDSGALLGMDSGAFLIEPGGNVALLPIALPRGMNNAGEIIGQGIRNPPDPPSSFDAFFLESSTDTTPLPIGLSEAIINEPVDINNNGVVVGYAYIDRMSRSAWLWDKMSGIRAIEWSALAGEPSALNDHEVIVGQANHSAFVYSDAEGFSLLPKPAGFGTTVAADINNNGWIAGAALVLGTTDEWRAVLWIPVPEPSSAAGYVFSLMGAAVFFTNRRRQHARRKPKV